MTPTSHFDHLASSIQRLNAIEYRGRVDSVRGLLVEASGFSPFAAVGDRAHIIRRDQSDLLCEIVGFRKEIALMMPYGLLDGVGPGLPVVLRHQETSIFPSYGFLGRVLNGLGDPIDGGDALRQGEDAYPLKSPPPPAHQRQLVGHRIDLGVRALNTFTTCCLGQRMGIFAASGIGKSVLLSQLARFSNSDVIVIGLIGERGREVREFIDKHLGEEGLKRSVVIVATSDESALLRRNAAYLTLAISEYFRDQGLNVLCLMDSVTRLAMALREIGLSAGEPPTSKGYPPSVFAALPSLLERAGPGILPKGSITGLFTVLVEGDDHNEPVSDTVRGILDGHIVLERAIAEQGRYPAVNILRSLSRTVPDCLKPDEQACVARARRLLSVYDDMAEMIRLGAYRRGSDPKVDEAIAYFPPLWDFLSQGKEEQSPIDQGFQELMALFTPQPSGDGADGQSAGERHGS